MKYRVKNEEKCNIKKTYYKEEVKRKKEILKKLMGSASTKEIDFNKVRDEWKYGTTEENVL